MITQTVARKIRLSDNALAFIVIALVLLMALGAEFFTALIGSRKGRILFWGSSRKIVELRLCLHCERGGGA